METPNIDAIAFKKTPEQISAEIAAAETIDEIIEIVKKAGGLKYSDGKLVSPENIEEYIREVEKNAVLNTKDSKILLDNNLRNLTRNHNLRNKVREILNLKDHPDVILGKIKDAQSLDDIIELVRKANGIVNSQGLLIKPDEVKEYIEGARKYASLTSPAARELLRDNIKHLTKNYGLRPRVMYFLGIR